MAARPPLDRPSRTSPPASRATRSSTSRQLCRRSRKAVAAAFGLICAARLSPCVTYIAATPPPKRHRSSLPATFPSPIRYARRIGTPFWRMQTSLQRNARRPDHIAPAVDLILHVSARALRGAAENLRRQLAERIAQLGLAQGLVHVGIDLVDDVFRRVRRR